MKKCPESLVQWHCIRLQKTGLLIYTPVKTSDLVFNWWLCFLLGSKFNEKFHLMWSVWVVHPPSFIVLCVDWELCIMYDLSCSQHCWWRLVSWGVTLCWLVIWCWCFGRVSCFHLHCNPKFCLTCLLFCYRFLKWKMTFSYLMVK